MTYKPNTLYRDLSNEKYHSSFGWYSSSQIKEALVDIEYFKMLYITKEQEKTSTSAMDIGTYFHTAILEPHKLHEECAIFEGARRAGRLWDEFKAAHADKTILRQTEVDLANVMVDAVRKDTKSMELLKDGEAEVSAYAELEDVKVRVRADWMRLGEEGFVLDLKSTQGNPRNQIKIKKTIEQYHYDLSAALYLDVFNSVLRAQKKPLLKDFYWTFASKDMGTSQLYRASDKMIALGRLKYQKALDAIKKGEKMDWHFASRCIDVDPIPYIEKQWKSDPGQVYLEPTLKVRSTGSDLL